MSPDSTYTVPDLDNSPQSEVDPSTDAISNHTSDQRPEQSVAPFEPRHIGPRSQDIEAMLQVLGVGSVEALIDQAVPESIRRRSPLNIPDGQSEETLLADLKEIAGKN